jgi:transposase
MRRAVVVELTEAERSQLEGLVRAGCTPQRTVRRARVVLLASKGEQNNAIARQVGMTPRGVGRWRRRFVEKGIAGLLKDLPGRGRRPTLSAERVAGIVASTTEELPPGRTQWSRSAMAKASGLSESTIGRIWRSHGIKPHRAETFKLSNDPRFAEKLEDVVGLYLNPPENAVVFSADEKSQIQALDRTQPGLPIKKGRAGTMTHDYKRHGTTTLFAALNVLTGVVTGRCKARHTHAEWLAFLKTLERQVPQGKDVHVVCDNYSTHKHPAVREWLADHPRVKIHFTPTSASWLNMVERFFRDITVNAIRRGVFTSVPDLIESIDAYLVEHNLNPKPFVWTASAKDILAKVMRAQQALRARLAALEVVGG